MIRRIPSVIGLVAAIGRPRSSSAFQPCRPRRRSTGHRPRALSTRSLVASATNSHSSEAIATALRMSSKNDERPWRLPRLDALGLEEQLKNLLPPAPEDAVALSGDMVALFVYSYVDHVANVAYAGTLSKMDATDLLAVSAYGSDVAPPVPVWFDAVNLPTSWLCDGCLPPPYAPALAAPGLAFVALATSWLASGYASGAFLHRNTVRCATERAMLVVLQTWFCTAALMVLLAWGSDAAWGALDAGFNPLSAPARGGLTHADADFIFGSLAVLAYWRFTFSWLARQSRG